MSKSKHKEPTILFVGPVRTKSAWGSSCREYISAIQTFTNNIKIKDLYMGGGKDEISDELQSLEKARFDSYDYVIQMCLPHLFYRDNRFKKNIGIFFSECMVGNNSSVYRQAGLMDHILVPSEFEKDLYKSCADVHNIGIPFDLSIADKTYENISTQLRTDNNTYVFYTIAEDNDRKNLGDLIRAYSTAFTSRDNVSLVIKTNKDISSKILKIQKSLRYCNINVLPEILTIKERMTDEQIFSLHQTADCFVTMSHGEAWCMPALEALAFKNRIIYPIGSGIDSITRFANEFSYSTINSTHDFCRSNTPPLTHYYTGKDIWSYPSVLHASQLMQHSAMNKDAYDKLDISTDYLDSFSHESIGKQIRQCLES